MIEELPSAPCFYWSLLLAAGNEYSWTQSLCSCPLPMRPLRRLPHCPFTFSNILNIDNFLNNSNIPSHSFNNTFSALGHAHLKSFMRSMCWCVDMFEPLERSSQKRHNGALHASLAESCIARSIWFQASYRCMLEMKCIDAMHFEAELRNEDQDAVLCSSAVSLRDDDWVCLRTMENAAGDLHKLLSGNMMKHVARGVGTGHRQVCFFCCLHCLHLSTKE